MPEYVTSNYIETENLGCALGKTLSGGEVVAMFGELGAGKTAFVRGVARGMGLSCDVSSPTFTIVNQYTDGGKTLYHFDMYRVTTWDSLYSTGFFDYLDGDAVIIIEWSENIEAVLPQGFIRVEITKTGDVNTRLITVSGRDKLI